MATTQGIKVPSSATPVSFTAFEALTRSNYHRPCQFTYAPSSISLQAGHLALLSAFWKSDDWCRADRKVTFTMQDLVNDDISWLHEKRPKAATRTWGLTKPVLPLPPPELVTDEHDEFCRICWTGVSI